MHLRRALILALTTATLLTAVGCGLEEEPNVADDEQVFRTVEAELTLSQRMARYAQIRDAAAGRGITRTAFLLAGIAHAETNLSHCWSEATWACQGPGSPDCGGGPVIAGSADGPCSIQQGGLGMFQFDAGTHAQTLAAYGNNILTVAGNTNQAISFVINMVRISNYTTNASTPELALQWIVNFDVNNATLRDQWIKTVTRHYNGCRPEYSCWSQRIASYGASLQTVIDETGLPFWNVPTDQAPTGWLDSAACDAVSGWAQDPDDPSLPIDVHLYFGGPAGSGAPAVSKLANIDRSDLCSAIGSCNHGYRTLAPLSLFDGSAHPVHAYGIGAAGGSNAQLKGSPKSLNCAATLPSGVRRHVVNPASYTAWRLDAFFDRLPVSEGQASALATASPMPATPSLVQADDGSPQVWVVDGELRRHVPSGAVVAAWRFDWGSIQTLPASQVYALTEGPVWRARPVEVVVSGAVYVIDDPLPLVPDPTPIVDPQPEPEPEPVVEPTPDPTPEAEQTPIVDPEPTAQPALPSLGDVPAGSRPEPEVDADQVTTQGGLPGTSEMVEIRGTCTAISPTGRSGAPATWIVFALVAGLGLLRRRRLA